MSVLQTKSGLRKYTAEQINQITPSMILCPPKANALKGGFPIEKFHEFNKGILNGEVEFITGIWTSEVGRIRFSTYTNEYELSTILRGRVCIYDSLDGQSIEFSAGDVLYLPPESSFEYEVLEPTVKAYMYIHIHNSHSYVNDWIKAGTPEFEELTNSSKIETCLVE
ncbi:conserved hypothetical protein [Gammaproteobacteria bacterium]